MVADDEQVTQSLRDMISKHIACWATVGDRQPTVVANDKSVTMLSFSMMALSMSALALTHVTPAAASLDTWSGQSKELKRAKASLCDIGKLFQESIAPKVWLDFERSQIEGVLFAAKEALHKKQKALLQILMDRTHENLDVLIEATSEAPFDSLVADVEEESLTKDRAKTLFMNAFAGEGANKVCSSFENVKKWHSATEQAITDAADAWGDDMQKTWGDLGSSLGSTKPVPVTLAAMSALWRTLCDEKRAPIAQVAVAALAKEPVPESLMKLLVSASEGRGCFENA